MGKRVHVVKRHAEYGSAEAFNWLFEEFYNFLSELGCYMCHTEDDYDNFECEVEEYKTALSLVKAYKKNGRTKAVEEKFVKVNADIDSFESYVEKLGGLDKVLEAMQAFYDQRDKKVDWISFSAW
jgi:hypothetical protein